MINMTTFFPCIVIQQVESVRLSIVSANRKYQHLIKWKEIKDKIHTSFNKWQVSYSVRHFTGFPRRVGRKSDLN